MSALNPLAPSLKLPLIRPDLPTLEEVEGPFREILSNGKITNFGKYNTLFEEATGQYLGCHAATTSSGSMGAVLVMKAMGVEPGKKVIVPSFTFMATAQSILYAGAVPVFAEVRDDLTLDVDDLDALLAKHHPDVTAVVPVHMYGLPDQVDAIQEVVDRHAARRGKPIRVVHDAAHAFGSSLADGRKCGTFGDAEVFSLSVTKLMVSVEGGMVTSRDKDLIFNVKKYRNYGILDNYNAHFQGLNGKMSEFHAIIGLYNLRRIEQLLATRGENVKHYTAAIQTQCRSKVMLPLPGVRHTFKDYSVLVPKEWTGDKRDQIMAGLKERGVETRAYFFPPVHEQAYFRQYADRPLPRTEGLARRVITLPFFTTITHDEMDYAAAMLAEVERIVA